MNIYKFWMRWTVVWEEAKKGLGEESWTGSDSGE